MSVYLTGDTHIPIDISKLNTKNFPDQKSLTRKDYVIVLGDFALLWHRDKEYEYWKEWLEKKSFTVLWIDGNHENHEWIDSLPVSEWHGGKVHFVSDNIIHLMRGQVFEIEGKYFWTFGGALSLDRAFRRESLTWWAREEGSYAEQMEGIENLVSYPIGVFSKVDYVLTHTCPASIVKGMFGVEPDGSVTGKYLDTVMDIISGEEPEIHFGSIPVKCWYFGHWHMEREYSFEDICFKSLYNSVVKLF